MHVLIVKWRDGKRGEIMIDDELPSDCPQEAKEVFIKYAFLINVLKGVFKGYDIEDVAHMEICRGSDEQL